jgi:predicted transcriptional regulator
MPSTTVRVSHETHAALQRLAVETGEPMLVVLNKAIEDYRRKCFLEGANADYAALRADPVAWQEELAERALWDATLMDDLEGE